jgi:sRNA-binding regulator protein Hfq
MDRHSRRNPRHDSPAGDPAGRGRRPPPPETTGIESGFWRLKKESRDPVALHLRDGERIEGVVEECDEAAVCLARDDGTRVWIPKTDIRYLEEGSGS